MRVFQGLVFAYRRNKVPRGGSVDRLCVLKVGSIV